jgi:hypothetical protein
MDNPGSKKAQVIHNAIIKHNGNRSEEAKTGKKQHPPQGS